MVRHFNSWRTHRDSNATNLDQLIKFPRKKAQKITSNIVLWMAFISVLSETQSRNSACMGRKVCKAVTKNQKAITFSSEKSSLLMVLKSLGFWWRKCRPRVKFGRAGIAA
jgi:4-hydroxy-3-methylbut-2-enyl diphosphate reductase IspH